MFPTHRARPWVLALSMKERRTPSNYHQFTWKFAIHCIYIQVMYCSRVKEYPPTPSFWPNFLFRVKVHLNVCPAWSELCVAIGVQSWSLRSTASSTRHIWGKKLRVILHRRLLQDSIAQTDVADVACTASYTMLTVTWCCSEHCAPSGLDFKAAGGSVVRCCLSASSHCKHDMGTLSWLNVETLERAQRCSAHGRSFARPWYIHYFCDQ